jgi:hypothetical protein
MDEELLNALLSSSIIFLSIGFSLIVALPVSRFKVKDRLSYIIGKHEEIGAIKFFAYNFYLMTMKIMEMFSYIFLVIAAILFSLPFLPNIKVVFYKIITAIVWILVGFIIFQIFYQSYKALKSAAINTKTILINEDM